MLDSIAIPIVRKQIKHLLNTRNQLPETIERIAIQRYAIAATKIKGQWTVLGCAEYCKRTFYFAEIRHVVTHPLFERRGVARYAIRQCMEKAHADGVLFVWMTTRADNTPMIRLCESEGFRRFRTRMNFTSGHDIIIWFKEIT